MPVGTTGESPTLTPPEHKTVIEAVVAASEQFEREVCVLAGCGSNSTAEAREYAEFALFCGCSGGLFVDPYYNGPSSGEIALYYYKILAEKYPDFWVVPYIIPGRTGTALSEVDLAALAWSYKNVVAVKEATGNRDRMKKTRILVPPGFSIISGDDDLTFEIMLDPAIRASGVISVISNIAPAAVQTMCRRLLIGQVEGARSYQEALAPLFKVVTVTCPREVKVPTSTPGEFKTEIVQDKFRNPDAIKTMMAGLGMPAGPCRSPLGRMTPQGVAIVRAALLEVWERSPTVLQPIADFYKVDIGARMFNDQVWAQLARS